MHLLWKGEVFEALMLFAKHLFSSIISHPFVSPTHFLVYVWYRGILLLQMLMCMTFLYLYCITIASVSYCLLNVLYLCHLCIVFLPEL